MKAQKQKRRTAAGICAAALLVAALLAAFFLYRSRHVEISPLHMAVEAPQTDAKNSAFAEGSGEALLLRGLEAYRSGDYEAAGAIFAEAAAANAADPAFPLYLPYYRNQCAVALGGGGSAAYVAQAFEAMRAYAPLCNDTDMLWELISSIALSAAGDTEAIALMEAHLAEAKALELATWAWLKNCIAMLQFNNEAYAQSIRNFYDVELALEGRAETEAELTELRYAKEYIANLYSTFEDHENAAVLYQELIDASRPDENARSYTISINLASTYLEMGACDMARAVLETLQTQFVHMDAETAAEVEATTYDIMANICLLEGDLAGADAYLDRAEAYYARHAGEAFLGGVHFVRLSRSKYLVQSGEPDAAQAILEELDRSGSAAYYGMEEELYTLLAEVYGATGQDAERVRVYEKLLAYDKAFTQTLRREYLAFSAYYRENNQLRARNVRLSRSNTVSFALIFIISAVLAAMGILAWTLRERNLSDPLTGAANRKKLAQLMRKYRRGGVPAHFGVLMTDIDYFKRYNDSYGHPAGDEVLREVAQVLQRSVRSTDHVIRYGGEEFLVLLKGLPMAAAEGVCARIHAELARRAIPHGDSPAASHVTLSMGLYYQEQAGGAPLEKRIEYADACLYQSKEAGRNRTTARAE